MIAWRTSRFLLYFFLTMGSIVTISGFAQYGDPELFSQWREFVLARVTTLSVGEVSPTPQPTAAAPEATVSPVPVAPSLFPPVHIEVPTRSPFDPAA